MSYIILEIKCSSNLYFIEEKIKAQGGDDYLVNQWRSRMLTS